MEVAQYMGNNIVRCIVLASSEGLTKDMEVTAMGIGITLPVGKQTLGRMFNVLGEVIDGGEVVVGEEKGSELWMEMKELPPQKMVPLFDHLGGSCLCTSR